MDEYRLEIRVLLCRSCGGPLSAPAVGPPEDCRYCGASGTDARAASEYSHDIRVLLCDHCGGPLPVPIGGGFVTCRHCEATSQVMPRRETPLSTATTTPDRDAARVARLRAQDGRAVTPPAELHVLMKRGGLTDATADRALAMWKASRDELQQLRAGAAAQTSTLADVEKRFYFLTELLSDYHASKQRRLTARSVLETALAHLENRRYIQIIYCWLARAAFKTGDAPAADAWLALCDPNPDDLAMDSAIRFTWVVLAMQRRDYATVLEIIGSTAREVPLQGKYDAVAGLYRAHALEQLEGPERGALAICESTRRVFPAWLVRIDIVEANAALRLCPRSFSIALSRAWPWWPVGLVIAAFVLVETILALGITSGLIGRDGERASPTGLIVIALLWALIAGGTAYSMVHTRRVLRKKLQDARQAEPRD